jgi:hypothetical protein
MANTTFKGPVRTGRDPGFPAERTIGHVLVQQGTTVHSNTSGASSIVIPPDTRISNMQVIVTTSVENALTQGALIRVGNTADATRYASIKVSGLGVYHVGVAPNVAAGSAAAWITGTGADPQRLFIDVTSAVAASAADLADLQAVLNVDYFQRA